MAKAKVTHSTDACEIHFKGDKRKPEPSMGVISFPGGRVEVSRIGDGRYWAHISIDIPGKGLVALDALAGMIDESRIDYDYEGYRKADGAIPPIPLAEHIQHIAVLVGVKKREAA